jgi:hypothetical protein
MSTNAMLASRLGGKMEAVSVHWDGYPTHLGMVLHRMGTEYFAGDIHQLAAYLIEEHPGGWSSLGGNPNSTVGADTDSPPPEANCCYCHCEGAEPMKPLSASQITSGEVAFAEWSYLLTEQSLDIFNGHDITGKPDASIAWDNAQVNWQTVECGEDFKLCHHYCSYHFDVPTVSSMLPTAIWLGREPMNQRHAVGFRIPGLGVVKNAGHMSRDADGTNIQELVLTDGSRIEKQIINSEGLLLDGIEPLFPPTALEDPRLLDGLIPGIES